MADTAASPAPATPAKGPKGRQAKPKKQKAVANHPKYVEMTVSAISALKERNGSSRQAILKYIMSHYSLGKDPKVVNTHLKMALKRGVTSGVLKHSKGQGASGSFRISGDKVAVNKTAAKPRKAAAAPAAPEKAAKVVAKKAKKQKAKPEKKAKSPKKESKKPKTPKKSVEKKKKKAAPKPKKPKTPKKSPAKKKAPKARKAAAKPKSPKAKRGKK